MHHDDRSSLDATRAAAEDFDSVVAMTRELVRIPSRGAIDPYDAIVDYVATWLTDHHLPSKVLTESSGTTVGLTCEIRGAHRGPRWVLDAPLDTAPFGDETAWTHPPTSGDVDEGWLWGRGAADSKSGVAIFCHIASRIAAAADDLHGGLVLLFDVDEHTGGFGGARRYFEGPDAPDDVAGVMIGYPGQDKLVVGGRGVHRIRLHVYGTASHSGGSATTPSAIQKAADLIRVLSTTPLPEGASAAFPLPGKLTVTAVAGGEGFSVTPDLCTLNVDIRTTPTFDSAAAAQHLEQLVRKFDHDWPDTRPTLIQLDTRWPAYALDQHSPLRAALLTAAADNGVAIEPKIAGPSNIGNYLAGLRIPATAGFGAIYTGLHGTDERIRIDSIPAVHATYHAAVRTLLRG
jgi:succinyl-diaminopimelate desuccinylase